MAHYIHMEGAFIFIIRFSQQHFVTKGTLSPDCHFDEALLKERNGHHLLLAENHNLSFATSNLQITETTTR